VKNQLKQWVLLAVAVACGLAASAGVNRYLVAHTATPTADADVSVIVAVKEVPAGAVIKPEMIKLVAWPKKAVLPGCISDPNEIAGRCARLPILAGEPVLSTKLSAKGTVEGLTGLIPSGKRAVTIKVNEVTGVAGFIRPGARVDVMVILPKRDEIGATLSRMILQDAEVLAVGQTLQQPDSDAKPIVVSTVTVLANPQEAERISLASNEGKIHLSLRNAQDDTQPSTDGITLASLAGHKPAAPVAVALPEPVPAPVAKPSREREGFVVDVVRGSATTRQVFSNESEKVLLSSIK
jgi:pilus assembly protein CpaB